MCVCVLHTALCVLSAAECGQDMWVFMCGVHVLRTVVRATVMQSVAMLHGRISLWGRCAAELDTDSKMTVCKRVGVCGCCVWTADAAALSFSAHLCIISWPKLRAVLDV